MQITSSMIGGFRVGGTVVMCLTKNADTGIGVRVVTNKVLSLRTLEKEGVESLGLLHNQK